FTIDNRGGADSGPFTIQVLLAPDTRIDLRNSLPLLSTPISVPSLAAGAEFTPAELKVKLPDAATAQAAGFAQSGLVHRGLRITPGDPRQDSGSFDKGGVHRGEDWETLTLVPPQVASGMNTSLTSADGLAVPASRVDGIVPDAGQTAWYQLDLRGGGGRVA